MLRLIFSAAFLSVVCAQPAAVLAGDFPVAIEETVLDNGLKVIVIPRKGTPAIACALVFRVGSVSEVPGCTGMAHFLEHMMFKGTEKIGVKDPAKDDEIRGKIDAVVEEILKTEDGPKSAESASKLEGLYARRAALFEEQKDNLVLNHIFKIYGDAGATFTNASTSEDWTGYYCLLPPEKIELFFWVESERLRNAVFRQFHAEKDVVREERRLYENRPGSAFREEIQKAVYGSHPYSHPILGWHEDLRVMRRADLVGFWKEHYTPDNAFMVVGGDVESPRVLDLARQYFGSIPRHEGRRRGIPALKASAAGEIRMYGSGRGKSTLRVIYRLPPADLENELAMEFVARHLGGVEGRLSRELVEKRKAAVSVEVDHDPRKYGGELSIRVELASDDDGLLAEAEILAAVRNLREQDLPREEMDRIRRKYRADVLGAAKSEMGLGFMILRRETTGSWRDVDRMLDMAKTIDPAAVRASAQAFLSRENSVVAVYAQRTPPPDAVPHRPEPPAENPKPGTPGIPASWTDIKFVERPFVIPSASESRSVLSNGMRVFLVRDPGSPIVRFSASVLGGGNEDSDARAGLSSLAAGLWSEAGTPSSDSAEIKKRIEDLAAELSVEADATCHRVTLEAFPSDFDAALSIFGDILTRPRFNPAVFERARNAMKANLDNEDINAHAASTRLFSEMTLGPIKSSRKPTRESLDALTLDQVQSEIGNRIDPSRIILAVSCDLDPRDSLAKLDRALGRFGEAQAKPYVPAADRNNPSDCRPGVHLRHMALNQGYVQIGVLGVPRGNADEAGLRVLSFILSKRIFNTVRSVHGLSYGAHAQMSLSWSNDSPVIISFQTKCPSVPFGIGLALDEARKLAESGPTEEEMAEAMRGTEASMRMTFGRGSDTADAFADLEANGIDLGYHRRLQESFRRVDIGAVRDLARKYLRRERFVITCVGDVAAMGKGDGVHPARLEDFGKAEMHGGSAADPCSIARGAVNALIEAVKSGDAERLLALSAGPMRDRLTGSPDFAAQLKSQAAMLKSAEFSIDSVEEKGESAEAAVSVVVPMGGEKMKLAMKLRLVRKDGLWKCEALQMGR